MYCACTTTTSSLETNFKAMKRRINQVEAKSTTIGDLTLNCRWATGYTTAALLDLLCFAVDPQLSKAQLLAMGLKEDFSPALNNISELEKCLGDWEVEMIFVSCAPPRYSKNSPVKYFNIFLGLLLEDWNKFSWTGKKRSTMEESLGNCLNFKRVL